MKKLLLTLGTVAAVAAPVASVVACGTKTEAKSSWDDLAKEYQSLQIMAYTNAGTNHLVKPSGDIVWTFKSATVFADSVDKSQAGQVELTAANDADKKVIEDLKVAVKSLIERSIKKFDEDVAKVNVDKAHPTAMETAAYKASAEIAKLIKGEQDYAATETAINTALSSVLEQSNIAHHDELETTDGIKTKSGVTLKEGEKELLSVGLPLLLKLGKTFSFAEALVPTTKA